MLIQEIEAVYDEERERFEQIKELVTRNLGYKINKKTDSDILGEILNYLNRAAFTTPFYRECSLNEFLFHHAVNDNYLRIVNYFKPQFLLGLTATPDRMDGKNIYEICDYNVPFEISLKEAINKGMLVPFHYYGIYDETTDYSHLHTVRGKYMEEEVNAIYIDNVRRYNLIYKYYQKYGSNRALERV